MSAADTHHLKTRKFFQGSLNRFSILADNIGIVTDHLILILHKGTFLIDNTSGHSAECSECVSGENSVLLLKPCDHGLRPMNHRDHIELQRAVSQTDLISFRHHMYTFQRHIIIPLKHRDSLGIRNYHKIRICIHHVSGKRGVIRLHMIDHQIIHRPVANGFSDIVLKVLFETALDCIYQSNLLINN